MIDVEQIAEYGTHIASFITTLVIGISLGLRRAQAKWAKEGAQIADAKLDQVESNVKADVIGFLHNEISRLAGANAELGKQVNAFQIENINLTARLATVTQQMTELQYENAQLGLQIVELRNVIDELKGMFVKCKSCPDFKILSSEMVGSMMGAKNADGA